jgi:hypothetical protein
MRFVKVFLFGSLLAMLAACGGGGGSPGATPNSVAAASTTTTAITTTTTSVSAADFLLSFDKTSVSNSGSDKVVLSIVALDSARNVVAGVPVQVSVDSDGVFSGSSGVVTDAAGLFSGSITTPGNKTDRTINVTARVGTIVKSGSVVVSGSKISVTPVPGAPVPSQAISVNLKLSDASNIGIAGQTLQVSGSAGLTGSITTDSNGNATIFGTAPAATGSYTVVVAGSGVSIVKAIQVISATGTGIPDAVGPLGPPSLNATPTNIKPNSSNVTTNRSALKFQVLNAANQGIANVRVRFKIVPPGLGSGEVMSTGDTIVYTDAAGIVKADYISGSRTSPTNGVVVRACYGLTNAAVDIATNSCTTFVDTNLTVAGDALNLSITDNNKLGVGLAGIIYIKQFVVQVGDSAGNPVSDATISASVDVTHYGKGFYSGTPNGKTFTYQITGGLPPTISDNYGSTLSPTDSPTSTGRVWCINEDLNRNGNKDVGDDLDGDGILEPRSSEVLVTAVGSSKTDANGQILLQASWGQNVGTWLAYTIKVTTSAAGSEGTNSRSFITEVLEADIPNGSFLTPPYGINNCSTNN